MFSWFFKKDEDKRFSEINNTVRNSFRNIKEDMDQVSKWVSHFKEKHDLHEGHLETHNSDINIIKERLGKIELLLEELRDYDNTLVSDEPSIAEEDLPTKKNIKNKLPRSQYLVCLKLALIQKDKPDAWVLQKHLAAEMYPEKEYSASRSAISQLVNVLEVNGYLVKRKVRRTIYVYLKKSKMKLFLNEEDISSGNKKHSKKSKEN